ncbi:signal-regulatory protein beta-2 [Lates calcarifer]|uniref:Signal-regulatory protein beta-2 n=1 Tax=Lates calcarifer TaxID=8187 RepID=A0AAJ7Q7Z2_LATCA|nr:signal-regulatory protein beta-2 [Lates calcarifer]
MIVLWVTLLVLHHGYSLVPVITVHLGEPVTFTCVLPGTELSNRQFYWFKQNTGDNLKLIVTLWKSTKPEFTPEFSESRLQVNDHKSFINLTIVKTIQEDEGMYHCAIMEWIKTKWSGTYLSVKGNAQRTSNYTVVQSPTVSDPVRPGESVTLQCSVLSDSQNKTCSGDHSVYWFRAGSDKSHPNIIYTDGNKSNECEKKPDARSPPKSCVYHFSKNISSSDSGTYYCAVATCGEIIFGDGTKLEIEGALISSHTTHTAFIIMGILIICLAISVIGNVVLICNQRVHKQSKEMESAISKVRSDNWRQQVHDVTEAEDKLNYVALNFSERKATSGRQRREFAEDSVYSQVRC